MHWRGSPARFVSDQVQLPVLIGEFSLALTGCVGWISGVGLAPDLPAASCQRVPCPTTYHNHTPGTASAGGPDADGTCPVGLLPELGAPAGPLEPDAFYKLLAEYTLYGLEASAGWM